MAALRPLLEAGQIAALRSRRGGARKPPSCTWEGMVGVHASMVFKEQEPAGAQTMKGPGDPQPGCC